MKKIELLAPAGNMESFVAAIEAGCDAVYLGGYMFGARNYAGNFSDEEIIRAINYAHLYGVKVYVTVNTVIYEDEVTLFINYIEFLHQNNVDAVIIQDIGMMDLVRQLYPNLEIHASTQMHIHNLEGVKLLEKIGIKRTVLARETGIQTIRDIKNKTNMELEIFVHGALCISYSGQCLMSSLIGGRSGNRGTCAQSCRQKYDLIINNKKVNKDEYLLSTKDLNTLSYIGELIDVGVNSIKIEGRMKRPEYVYLVVSLYRKAIDSYIQKGSVNITDTDILELRKIFNRDFTKGFLFNENNNNIVNPFRPNHLGIEVGKVLMSKNGKVRIKLSNNVNLGDGIRIIGQDEDVGCELTKMEINGKLVREASTNQIIEIYLNEAISDKSIVLKTTDAKQLAIINQSISAKRRKVSITGTITIVEGQPVRLEISDGINNVIVTSSELVSMALNNPLTTENVTKQLKKLGNTNYEFEQLKINLGNNVFVQVKTLNEVRRQALESLSEKRLYHSNYLKGEYHKDILDYPTEKKKSFLINNLRQYELIKEKFIDEIYVKSEQLYKQLNNDKRVILKLPRVMNSYTDYQHQLLVGELGSINKYQNVYTDFSLNITNSYSIAFLHGLGVKKVTLSYELEDRQIKDIINNYQIRYHRHPNLEIIIYGKEEVMISKFNLLNYYDSSSDKAYLKDRFNNFYPIRIQDNLMYIYNYKTRKYTDANKYYEMGINSLRINLLDEDNNSDFIKYL